MYTYMYLISKQDAHYPLNLRLGPLPALPNLQLPAGRLTLILLMLDPGNNSFHDIINK